MGIRTRPVLGQAQDHRHERAGRVHPDGELVWISDSSEGARHDVFCLDESGALDGLNPGDWPGDKGYVGRAMIRPIKKTTTRPKLLDWQKTFNTAFNKLAPLSNESSPTSRTG